MSETPQQPPQEPDMRRHTTPPWLKRAGTIGLSVVVVVAVAGLAIRWFSGVRTAAWTEAQTIPTVQTISLKGARRGGDLTLPGDIEAFTNAPIYAQISGYVKKWYYDIGAPVKQGAVLAEIDPRPFQAALTQAQGQLARDQATLANYRVTARRQQALAAANATSQQALSDALSAMQAEEGVVQSDRAAVETARINLGYTRITAPFDGVVTSRTVDIGNLVTVGTASSTTPLFTVTDEKKLRIYVHLPQVYSNLIRPGMTASFTVPEYPGRDFAATLTANARAVSRQSGTQLVQFEAENPDGALKPGSYAEVHLTAPAGAGAVRMPATALMFRESGMMVATVDSTDHVVLKPITIRSDLGTAVEVSAGVTGADRVIDNPPDSLQAGDKVRVIATAGRAAR
jgi:RND family efflux transporter MFP subunit